MNLHPKHLGWVLMNGIFRASLPPFCMANSAVSDDLDKRIRDYLKTEEIVIIDQFHIKLGDMILWAENYPYESFHECMELTRTDDERSYQETGTLIPRPITRFQLNRAVLKKLKDEAEEEKLLREFNELFWG